ncbi:site-specific integrase [Marivirga salinae]|uniref:Site-specific integrase n=1 Tax=Marivirga salinarum TaxID=3059078 RepID=A0AA51NB49_9BACT|nr:site-specific integrase [Marivirga sp. BDSF4-3]WMN11735.1 site-specific integrase [Marivirga sp. BDSF4-3]
MSNSFSVKFILKKYKAKNGEAPIYMRISHNGKNCDTSLKRKVLIEKWNQRQRVSGTSQEVVKLNRYLDKIYNKAFQIFEQLVVDDESISAEIIRNAVFNINEQENQITLLYLSKYHFENANHKLKWGTLKHYQVTERYFERFLKAKFKLSDIPLKKIDYKFLIDFEDFLRNWEPQDHQKPMNNNGVMKHMIRFRKLLKLALRLDWIEKNPFISYQTHFEKVERDFLDANELKAIEEKEFSLSRLDMVRDIFIFSCYTGLSYVDLYHLSEEDITVGMDGERWIHLKRIKTNTSFSVMLLPKAEQIIEKYQNHPRVFENQLLPVFSNQKTNSYLKEIADLCEIKKKLTFHIARHTFATTVTLTNGVPIETVSKMLGHTKLATTQIYAKVVENKIGSDMAALKKKLSINELVKKAD